jgi:hemolysin III
LVYSAGAAVYALRRPDPVPAVFGYHEVFHLLVIAGVAAHFLAISLFVLPTGRTQRSARLVAEAEVPPQ